MNEPCTHQSVGIIVLRGESILLIERRNPPFGFAPPGGHVDPGEEPEIAAVRELREETGLEAIELVQLLELETNVVCSRPDGAGHHWRVYLADATGSLKRNEGETKSAIWCEPSRLQALADRTRVYLRGGLSEEVWQKLPGLEPVWLKLFAALDVL